MIMDRIDCGEEVDLAYVRNTLTYCVDLWNECTHSIRGMMQNKSMELLKECDSKYAEMTAEQLEKVFQDLVQKINRLLRTIDISNSESALRIFGGTRVSVQRDSNFKPNCPSRTGIFIVFWMQGTGT